MEKSHGNNLLLLATSENLINVQMSIMRGIMFRSRSITSGLLINIVRGKLFSRWVSTKV